MDASELILNLVQKAAIKTEAKEKDLCDREHFPKREDSPSPDGHAVVKNSFSRGVPEKSCDDCKKEKAKGEMFKVSLTTDDEGLKNDKENVPRKKIRVEARQICDNREKSNEEKIFVLQQLGRSQIHPDGFPAFLCIDDRIADSNGVKRKIPRPANAFMLFANEWRKKLATENPRESNKDISVRLGILWKNMAKDVKEKYFALAREVDAEHKRKYPDYVYNPKEARLRKAMREQSRELSRRSILQSAIARAGVIASPVTSGGFLDHQHRFGCMSTASLPMNSSVEPDRVSEPWFQSASRPKPIHSPRMAPNDWYVGNVADPIERLQIMGAMAHQRGLDKCKDAMRNQTVASVANTVAAECGATFSSNGYPVDFSDVNRERELRRQESMEYGEFPDGQKWHPYQNGGGAHQHPRTSHAPQMSNILHPNIQSPGSQGHGSWGQFCHGMLPHTPPMPRNIGIRGPRHTMLLRDRMPPGHCEFPEEAPRMVYHPSKLDLENVRASYTPSEHQVPRLLETSIMDSASTLRIRREDDGPRWEPSAMNNRMSMDNLAPTRESSISREKESESRRSAAERFEPKKKSVSKQPLPGFHQAFGSTEIGRFSRSEFFVNMVGESGGNVDVADTEVTNSLPKTYLSAPVVFPFSSRSCGILGTSSAAIHRITESREILSRIMQEECCWFATQSRCGVSRISEDVVQPRNKECFCRGNTMIHPSEVLRRRENYESFISERGDGGYVIISASTDGNRNNSSSTEDDEFGNEICKKATLNPEKNDGNLI